MIYIASALPNRDLVRRLAASLREPVVSSWHDTDATIEIEQSLTLEAQARIARRCLSEIDRATSLYWVTGNTRGRCGAAFEAGFAIGRGLPVVVQPAIAGEPVPTIMIYGAPGVTILPWAPWR